MLELPDLFNESYYLSTYSDVAAAVQTGIFRSGLDHYQQLGQSEKRQPSAFFNETYYLQQSPDVAAAVQTGAFNSGLQHYLQFGQREGRESCAVFTENFYRRANPDVASATDPLTGSFSNCLEHYLQFGQTEGRDPFARVVVLWDETAQQAVRNTNPGPTIASRAYGILHTALFDAWAAYDPVAIGTQLGDTLQRPTSENSVLNKSEAMSYAAYHTLVDLFPSQIGLLDNLMQQLGYDPQKTSPDPTTPSSIGIASAQALLNYRHQDGANQLNRYQDTTGYQPANTPDTVNDLNHWQPLQVNGQVQKFLTPHWGDVTPFGLTSGSEFRPVAPVDTSTEAFQQQVQEVLDLSANLTDEQKIIAEFWEDGAGTAFPPGTWMGFGQFVSQRDRLTLDEEVKLFFILGNAVMDAGIAAWDAKQAYDYVRPVTAIRTLYNGQQIQAWGTTTLIDGKDWKPYQSENLITPPFPEYVSGHSTFSAAAAEVLKRFTGSDVFGGVYSAAVGSSRFEPGITPHTALTLSWTTFSEAADQAGISRRYGGIHFRDGDLQGRLLGRQVGDAVWQQSQYFIQGGKNLE